MPKKIHNKSTEISRGLFYCLSCSLFGILVLTSSTLALDEATEPGVSYSIEIDGRTHHIELDKPLLVKGQLENPTLTLHAATSRKFDFGGISFSYPAAFGWEADLESNDYKHWTLSGNDIKIIYFRTSTAITPEGFSESMLKKFSGSKAREATQKLGDVILRGKSFSISPGGVTILNQVFTVPIKNGFGLLVFQDSDTENNKNGKEGQEVLKMLIETFRITPTME